MIARSKADSAEISEHKPPAEAEDFEFAALAAAVNYRSTLVREFSRWLSGRVLEVGAGIGQMSALLCRQPGVTELAAVEPEARFREQFHKTLADSSLQRAQAPVKLLTGTVKALGDDREWNAIVNINVLEHIEDDRGELQRYCRLLERRRGVLCLFVPARPEIYAPIDKDFGHFRRYRRNQLREKLSDAGFQILRLKYFNVIGYFAWWWTFCVLRRRRFDAGAVRLFDRMIFPVGNVLERLLPSPPLGQSLLAVARAT